MSQTDVFIEHYYALNPVAFPVLVRLRISQTGLAEPQSEVSLEMELRSRSATDSRRLVLSFHGVRNLRLVQSTWSEVQFPLIEITSIQNRQWENLHYEVKESEEGGLLFLCESFGARVTES